MKIILQRVTSASVSVDDEEVGSINQGLCVLVGFKETDTLEDVKKLALKLGKLRIFADEDKKMNLSIKDIKGQILSISQFTLYADTSKGNRPSFFEAASPQKAKDFYDAFNSQLKSEGFDVQTGIFGADMQVEIHNDGPVTIELES